MANLDIIKNRANINVTSDAMRMLAILQAEERVEAPERKSRVLLFFFSSMCYNLLELMFYYGGKCS